MRDVSHQIWKMEVTERPTFYFLKVLVGHQVLLQLVNTITDLLAWLVNLRQHPACRSSSSCQISSISVSESWAGRKCSSMAQSSSCSAIQAGVNERETLVPIRLCSICLSLFLSIPSSLLNGPSDWPTVTSGSTLNAEPTVPVGHLPPTHTSAKIGPWHPLSIHSQFCISDWTLTDGELCIGSISEKLYLTKLGICWLNRSSFNWILIGMVEDEQKKLNALWTHTWKYTFPTLKNKS